MAKDRILLDPGIGFGKTYEMNLEALRRLDEFCSLGYPVLLGTSRKSVIGLTLDLPADQRLEGTLVTTVLAVQTGCALSGCTISGKPAGHSDDGGNTGKTDPGENVWIRLQ